MDQTKIISDRFCQQTGHENEKLIPSLCIAENCDKKSRLLCQECLLENLHSHGSEKPQYLQKDKFLELLNQKIEALKQNHQQGYLYSSQYNINIFQIIEQMNLLCQNFKQIQQQLKNPFSDQDEIYFESLRNQIKDQFYQLNNENVNDILRVSQYVPNTENKIQLNKICKDLIDKSQNLIYELNNLNESSLNFKNLDDKIRCIQITSKCVKGSFVNEMRICPNNKYIATLEPIYHSSQKVFHLKLFDIYTQKDQLRLETPVGYIRYFQFSDDSQYFYYQEINQPFMRFQFKDQKLQEYKHFLELNSVRFITQISENIVCIINNQNQIQKLDFQYQNKLFEQQSRAHLIKLLYDRINNLLISSGELIEFWQVQDGVKIYEDNRFSLKDIQFTKVNSQIVGFDEQNLYLIQIVKNQNVFKLNLQKKKIDEVIISFSVVLSQQYIVLFGENGLVKIYNSDFQMVKQQYLGLNLKQLIQFLQQ
ncbi:hypothetical protein pb186bvf_007991 [Paramecium bursaria]